MYGLGIMSFGLLCFVPSSIFENYYLFLGSLFIVASGLTLLQVAINPYIPALGSSETAASRLNLGGAFNSLATFVGPIVGGWLILKDRLSIGQLVACELIISAVLYNIANLGRDFENFYDLISSSEKLSQFQNIPHEKILGQKILENIEQIKFQNILYQYRNNKYCFDLYFAKGENYLLLTNGYSTKKIIIDMILGLIKPISGNILYNNISIEDYDYYQLRSQIALIDNSPLIEGTLREYLTFNQEKISENYVMMVLDNVGLRDIIIDFNEGLDLRILQAEGRLVKFKKIFLKLESQ